MTVRILEAPLASGAAEPDVATPPPATASAGGAVFERSVASAFEAAQTALGGADAAERAFAAGRGGLQEMVLERAQADVALSIAGAAASRTAQALNTILGMQV